MLGRIRARARRRTDGILQPGGRVEQLGWRSRAL